MAKKSYSPVEYKQDFMNLAATNPADAADVAMKWRDRFHNAVEQARTTNEQLMEFGIAGLTSGILGGFGGWMKSRRAQLLEAWTATDETGAYINEDVTTAATAEELTPEAYLEKYPAPWNDADVSGISREPGKWFLPASIVTAAGLGLLAAFDLAPDFQRAIRAGALGAVVFVGGELGALAGANLQQRLKPVEMPGEGEETTEDA